MINSEIRQNLRHIVFDNTGHITLFIRITVWQIIVQVSYRQCCMGIQPFPFSSRKSPAGHADRIIPAFQRIQIIRFFHRQLCLCSVQFGEKIRAPDVDAQIIV